ncbi:MAG: DEAD/DEAH box helicase [Vicinamibacteria bacterium]|nr:DEAD/DEAH box helicase [Vicinamibacteria bacterium]
MNVFELRRRVIDDYGAYVRSFISIRDERLRQAVDDELKAGLLWPEARIGLNPAFAEGGWIDDLVSSGLLHPECSRVFRGKSEKDDPGRPLRLHRHQVDAVQAARAGRNYVLTTGTGSGKSLSYIVPIVDAVLRGEKRRGIKAIVVYPMNALANSQHGELTKFLSFGYPDGKGPVSFRRYTGQESDEEKRAIIADPPDILLTNYVMLELILTRTDERELVAAAKGLRFLVLDELHTYRGRQGADVALLVRRAREACESAHLQHVGTSATMATGGTVEDQQREVARVASLIFGAPVEPEGVIGETLRRVTPESDFAAPAFRAALHRRLGDPGTWPPSRYEELRGDPLSAWIESTFGLGSEPGTGRLVRAQPRMIGGPEGAARELASLSDVAEDLCAEHIQRQLLAGYEVRNPETGFPFFAFRLHQFISRGDTAWATLEPEALRHITLHPQRYAPESQRAKLLYPVTFCRECGQEYYSVQLLATQGGERLEPRPFDSKSVEAEGDAGYLYVSTDAPWAFAPEALPDDWLEAGDPPRVKYHLREAVPRPLRVSPDGVVGSSGVDAHWIPVPFRFCLRCKVAYGGRARSDFSKLGTLGSEGRSTATTILSLSAVRHLRRAGDLQPEARKLLSFTDNRQDASLQAGHFNDFVEVGLLRSALHRAALAAGPGGLSHEVLAQRVFDALALPLDLYAADPGVKFAALTQTQKALRDVIAYRLYLDLRRGWRITSPNLEQTGLLRIEYESLSELAADVESWQDRHPALVTAKPEQREAVCRVMLDFLRRELAVKVDALDPLVQEQLKQVSSQRLRSPWALDEQERLVSANVAVPGSRGDGDDRGFVYLSPRGRLGQYLRRPGTLPQWKEPLKLTDADTLIQDLLVALRVAGLVQVVREPEKAGEPAGYQVPASAMRWVAGDGTAVPHDPIRVPNPPAEGSRPNRFFLDFYRNVAADGQGLEAREHTAQVPYEAREERERRFREARLPVLYCSPTMELGVDIASLNVVNLRNVPPSPANYAQRSGRAGRSGQPALVITYCSAGSPHDQYFFRRPQRMVSGQVTPPRLDVGNEDLVRAHVHSVWLSQSHLSLGRSLKDLLDVSGEAPTLALQPHVQDALENERDRERAKARAERMLETVRAELERSNWWGPSWLEDAFRTLPRSFQAACDRWRSLYRSARGQVEAQNAIILDASRGPRDRDEAKKLRREAEAQLELLTATGAAIAQSDFYSYRYFASEGFLPGYSFPRLPLSAFIPGRKLAVGADEFLARPRFLAISEFGPRNFLYHEGSRYVINRVILPVTDAVDPATGRSALTSSAKLCSACSYVHPLADGNPDLCESCGAALPPSLNQLFRLQNVTTVRRDRINSDEEERQRQGYQIESALRFGQAGGRVATQSAEVSGPEGVILRLVYGHAATIWRINLGWKRRKDEAERGFVLDVERGYWVKDPKVVDEDDPPDNVSHRTQRVIPFVEDRKNALLVQLPEPLDPRLMASLQAALKHAIAVEFQLEESELAAEPLPRPDDRRALLLYESAEGGAGVLRQLVEDPEALGRVARRALEICHFGLEPGTDLGHAPNAKEPCEAACYDCLMSYTNQPDHKLLDRFRVEGTLRALAAAAVAASPGAASRDEHFDRLSRLAASELERRWLRHLRDGGHTLPDEAAVLVEKAGTRPDFLYRGASVAIYVDGPPHDYPQRAERDRQQQAALEDLGYVVLRFRHDADWTDLIAKYPSVFGAGK